jgi:rare lipoprotein A
MNHPAKAVITTTIGTQSRHNETVATLLPFCRLFEADIAGQSGTLIHNKRRAPHMLARKLGYLAVTGSLLFSFATVAEAKHRSKHSHRSTHSSEQSSSAHSGSGVASVYASKGDRYAGRRTASGERVQAGALTAAHRSLPFGTMVRVTNRRNNQSVVVRINDRGPFVRGRVIDLTPAGARAIGFSGLAPVSLSVMGRS